MNLRPAATLLLFFYLTLPAPLPAQELNGSIALEGRFFTDSPLYPEQEHHNGSIALAPEFYYKTDSDFSFIFVPFLRLDSSDSERTHFDIRELNFLFAGNPWAIRLGIGKVFWGVTEFVHLVDIINQTDLVEDLRGEDKLGQPMVHLSIPGSWGMLDIFALPYFRERTFPGLDGRLRTGIAVDTDNPVYESGAEENHFDYALRYSQVFSSFDLGMYYFRGTSREPLLIAGVNSSGQPVLLPYYQQIDQAGMDLQLVSGNWLWKLEALYQDNDTESFFATTGGVEYTFVGLGNTMADLGIIGEFAYDDREDEATTSFARDLLLGLRLAINDAAGTEFLAGLSYDLDNSEQVLRIEASRRITDNIKLFLDGWFFIGIGPDDDYLYSIRNDDFVRLQIFYYF